MYFCPNCSYIFDIAKSSKVSTTEDKRMVISKSADAFKMLDDKSDFTKFRAEFAKEELEKNKKYNKLNQEQINKLNLLFEIVGKSGAEFKCSNCDTRDEINETTLLYQIDTDDTQVKLRTLEENELLCKDPTLAHTHDYSCKNPKCITHAKPDVRDSVFFKEKSSYKPVYICCVCFYSW